MKKIIVFIIALLTIYFISNKNDYAENIIPDSAIRFRIIANSNTVYDQNIKIQVRNTLQNEILKLTKDSNSISETRKNTKRTP